MMRQATENSDLDLIPEEYLAQALIAFYLVVNSSVERMREIIQF